MVGIYTITSPTNKIYVGQSYDIKDRVRKYKICSCKNQRKLYHSIKKHGWVAHTFEVILELREDVSKDTMNTWEEYFMDLYKSQGFELLNIREAGSNGRLSNETKLKLSKYRGELNHAYGKKGKDSHRYGVKLTEEHKLKISGKGRKHSEETKKILSDTKKGDKNPFFKGHILVYKNDMLVGRYEGVPDAARNIGISFSKIYKNLNTKIVEGFLFVREPKNSSL